MKKVKTNGKFWTAIGLSVAMLCGAIFAGGGYVLTHNSIQKTTSSATAGYDQLIDGTSYYFTDLTKVQSFHDGTGETDMSSQAVSSNQTHGSINNPFVINTTDQWNAFAQDTSNLTDANKVFFLASDLDFSGKTFIPVKSLFNGKFYGNGRTLKNVSCNFSNVASGDVSGCSGVFLGIGVNAVIADFNVDDFNFINTSSFYGGGICGKSLGGSVLNCHTKGSMVQGASSGYKSGIMGYCDVSGTTEKDVYIYRCSTKVEIGGVYVAGGLLSSYNGKVKTHILDCLSIIKTTATSVTYSGGAVGYAELSNSSNPTNHVMENIVCYTDSTHSSTASDGSLFGGWCYGPMKMTIKNTYSSASVTYRSSKYNLCPIGQWSSSAGRVGFDSVVNAHAYVGGTAYPQISVDLLKSQNKENLVDRYDGSSGKTQADLYAAAATDSNFSDKIWGNKSVINETYMTDTNLTSANGYSIENSPVRNPLVVRVQYLDHRTSGDEIIVKDPSILEDADEYWDVLVPGDELVDLDNYSYDNYSPAANHKFLGWTTDKTGKQEPFMSAKGLVGEIKLYAVWGVEAGTATASIAKEGSFTDGENGAEFVYGKGSIKLISQLSVANMNDAKCTLQWKKDGTDISSATGETFSGAKNVRDSGKYKFTCKFQSASQPLWRGEVESGEVQVTIAPAPLKLESIGFKDGQKPYSGTPYEEITPEPIITNEDGSEIVAGESVWKPAMYEINSKDYSVVDENGYETKTITFKPAATYGGNYGEQVDFTNFRFKIEYLTMTFKVGTLNIDLTTEIEYGQIYSYLKMANMFDAALSKYLTSQGQTDLGGYTPYLQLFDGTTPTEAELSISEYRARGTQTAINKPKTSLEMRITLQRDSYTVHYDTNGGTGNYADVTEISYGRHLEEPSPKPTNSGQMFLGWFVDTIDENGNKQTKKWDFNEDRVTGNMTLYADWLVADTLIKIEVTQKKDLTALDALKSGDLEIRAYLSGTAADGTLLEETALIDFADLQIEYLTSAAHKELHIKKDDSGKIIDTPVKVTYSVVLGGRTQTKEKEIGLIVKQKEINSSHVKFEDDSKVYDGTGKQITLLTGNIANNEIRGYKLTYYDESGMEMAPDVYPIEMGSYPVVLTLIGRTADYKDKNLNAVLHIIAAKTKVTVDWGNRTFMYNAKVQYPVPTFYVDGVEVPIEFRYTEGTDKKAVGNNYNVTIEIVSAGYEFAKPLDMTTTFEIVVAELDAPTMKGAIVYTGEEIKLYDPNNPDACYLLGFDPDIMKITVNPSLIRDAGNYTAIIELTDKTNCKWKSQKGTETVKFEVEKAHLTALWDGYEHVADGSEYYPRVSGFVGLADNDSGAVNYVNDILYTGDIGQSAVGDYKIIASFNGNDAWKKNYIFDGETECTFVIVPQAGMEILSVEWTSENYVYNGEVQQPTYRVLDKDGNEVDASVLSQLDIRIPSSKYNGEFKAEIAAKDGNGKYFVKGGICTYRIIKNSAGEGDDPAASVVPDPEPDNPPSKPDDGNTDTNKPNNGITLPADMPWWQLALGLVSIVLIIVFTSKGAKYGSERKKCVKEAKKLRMASVATPAALLVFLMANNIWTIVACALAGLAVLSLVYMIIQKRRFVKAEAGLESAQIEYKRSEKDQQEEERRRRDEEFKMMMASMMNPNMQAAGGYVGGDIKEIVGDVVASLMPAMQQTMQALPAPDNSELRAVIEQQQQMIEQMMNNQAMQALPLPDSGAEERIREMELRMAEQQRLADERLAEQLAQQQAMMAEQQRLADERHAEQLAQQQEMMAQQQRLADERMAQMMEQVAATMSQNVPQPQTVVQTDDGLREILEKHGEMLNDLMGKENVNNTVVINKEGRGADDEERVRLTLKEAYEKLTDPLKKVFDAARDYIVLNQEVVASEGKFAITYKYRGKQYLKLNIKRGYPTISYSTEGEQLRNLKKKAAEEEGVKVRFKMSELQIFDDSTLEVAKGVIDLRREQIDKDIEFMKKKK